jgi:hypothetical protein
MTLRLMKPYYSPPLYQLSYRKLRWGVTLDEDQTHNLGFIRLH